MGQVGEPIAGLGGSTETLVDLVVPRISRRNLFIENSACARMKQVVGKVKSLRRVLSASDNDGVLVTRLVHAVDNVTLDNDVREWRIVELLAGVELQR